MKEILQDSPGKRLFLLGNVAIVRGALEAGLDFAATYPGTPSSEIGNTLYKIGKDAGVYFEFSTNEKVALETGGAAAASGLRTLVFMKHVGLNVASDAFMTLAYSGVRGGMVIVTADDPSCHSSQNEQDNRYFAQLAGVPMFEPSSPQEAKEMTRLAFELSEKLELPVLLRTTTRINHVSGPVTLGPLGPQRKKGHFDKNPGRFVVLPAHARKRHILLLKTLEEARAMAETSELNFKHGKPSKLGIIGSGAGYNYAADLAEENNLDMEFLKLGFTFPFPKKLAADFMMSKDVILVVEELEPYMEKELLVIAKTQNMDISIKGKLTGDLPFHFEYDPDTLKSAFSNITGKDMTAPERTIPEADLPARPPNLCAGCPHRATFFAMKRALRGKDVVHSTDIGCYTLGILPPFEAADYLLCMGSSIGAAGGFAHATDQLPVAILGDSTFFHAGLSGMVNAVYNGGNLIYVILDNRTTAMTGHQPNPGMGVNGRGEPSPYISIEDITKACGSASTRVVDPYDTKATIEAFQAAKDEKGVRVIIPKRECALIVTKELKAQGVSEIDQEACKRCYVCLNQYACPAFYKDGKDVHIDPTACAGCHVCIQVCPFNAIHVKGVQQ